MKHFSLILAFVSAAIAAPTPGWPKKTDKAGMPDTEVKKIVNDKWPVGQKKDCIFWTGFDDGIPKDRVKAFMDKLSNAVWWYDFFDDDTVSDWQWGLGDPNAGYSVAVTSAAYAERCGQDAENVWILIPSDRSPDNPYPKGSKKPRAANWSLWEVPFVTMPNKVKKIVRINPATADADMKDDKKIIWKAGDGQKGVTKWPKVDSTVWSL